MKQFILLTLALLTTASVQAQTASWYGGNDGYHGKRTASGEIFNHNQLTAAHKTLKFGTKLCVTNTANGKTVTVKITDRGPFAGKERVLDLSKAAFQAISPLGAGVINISYKVCN
jgi:rare lipoprotein A